jgi:hypothetical protein
MQFVYTRQYQYLAFTVGDLRRGAHWARTQNESILMEGWRWGGKRSSVPTLVSAPFVSSRAGLMVRVGWSHARRAEL